MDILTLRQAQSQGAETLLDALKTVELNVTELCNRTCSFCPRSDRDLYPNQNLHMSLDTVKKAANDLSTFNYSNRVSIVGFGEPTLYKELPTAIGIIRDKLPNLQWLEVNTNGDNLSRYLVESLSMNGCNQLTISMYDHDVSEKIHEMCIGININLTFKHCYKEKFELKLVNRTEIATKNRELNLRGQCYIPFYKMFIDHNGDVLLCNNDWGRDGKLGNIHEKSIRDVWLTSFQNIRNKLIAGDRSERPCKFCNVNGMIFGEDSFKVFKNEANTD